MLTSRRPLHGRHTFTWFVRRIVLLVALVGATTLLAGVTTGSAQHAGRHLATYHSSKPTVSVDALNITVSEPMTPTSWLTPSSMYVSGQGFTAGDSLHLQLIASDGPHAWSVLAEGDTTASLDVYLTQADGQDVLVPGGQFTARLTASPASDLACQAMTHAAVTVVDTATGESASTNSLDISGWGCVPPPAVTDQPSNQRLWASTTYGVGFTPGGAVHIDLEIAVFPSEGAPGPRGPFQLAGLLDTTAATATYGWNSDGIVYTPGGYFAVTVGLDPAGPGPVCVDEQPLKFRYFDWYVVATDVATGRTATGPVTFGNCA